MFFSANNQYILITNFTEQQTPCWVDTKEISSEEDIIHLLNKYNITYTQQDWTISYKNFANTLVEILGDRPSVQDLFLAIEILKDWDNDVVDLVLKQRISYGQDRLMRLKEDLYSNFEGYFEHRDDYVKQYVRKNINSEAVTYLTRYIMWDKITQKLETTGAIQILSTGYAEYYVFSQNIKIFAI